MTINEKIRARRKELGMSQDALAKKVGYAGRSAISKIESGEREVKWSTVLELSQALKWSTDDIARIAGLVDEDDAEFVKSLGHIYPKEDLPDDLAVLNVLVRDIGWEIIKTNGEYYLGEIGLLSDADVKRLKTAAVSALKVTYDMMVKERGICQD